MSKNHGYALILACVLLGVFASAIRVQMVEAQGTIYIRADGSIDPPTAPIQRVDDLYTFTGDISDMIAVERNGIIIDGNGYTLLGSGFGNGIDLTGRTNVRVQNTQIKSFSFGIRLYSSCNNSISGNTITNSSSSGCGIGLYSSSNNNSVSENNMINNFYGIGLFSSSNNSISENNITNNVRGIHLDGPGSSNHNSISGNNITNNGEMGLFLHSCFNNSIIGNNMTANGYNCIWLSNSRDNSIGRNTIANSSGFGIWLYYSSDNRFYNNNFIDNGQHVHVSFSGYANVWDDGYPSGGNYWSGYVSPDLSNGPNQNVTGGDGIGDNPYVIDADNRDNYPFSLLSICNASQIPTGESILSTDHVKINATITHLYTVEQVMVNCIVTNDTGSFPVSISMTNLAGNVWNTTIPPFPNGTNITYTIIAHDTEGNTINSQQQGYTYKYQVIPEYSSIIILLPIAVTTLLAAMMTKARATVGHSASNSNPWEDDDTGLPRAPASFSPS